MSSKIELGFDYADGKHIPTIKISLEPCGPDGLVWDERDMLGKRIEKLIAAPVVERQPADMQWQYEAGSAWWAFDAENVGDNIASGTKIRLTDHAGKVLFSYPAPELAELQAENSNLRLQCGGMETEIAGLRSEIERLKDGQGEPVALPDPKPESRAWGHDMGGNYDEGHADGWNACLDKVKELNQ